MNYADGCAPARSVFHKSFVGIILDRNREIALTHALLFRPSGGVRVISNVVRNAEMYDLEGKSV